MITLQNAHLQVRIKPKGAELVSLILLESQQEFMWEGNPDFWGKHSPVLFPIVGGLKNTSYHYRGQNYQLPRHGFARDKTFEVVEQESDSVTFSLTHDDSTLAVYPFEFVFKIRYQLRHNRLEVSYLVENPSEDSLWFSVGGHPAFKVPLTEGTQYNDYVLTFNQKEDWARWPLSAEGLIEQSPVALLNNTTDLHLSKPLFYEDALVFKGFRSDNLLLHSAQSSHSLRFDFAGFPYLGIWAAPNADFVCIEPWCGIADSVAHNQDFTQKEGIIELPAKAHFERTWAVTLM